MSLVRASPSRQRAAGALLLLLIAGGVLSVLALAGRSLGPGIRFSVELARTGALRPSARIKLAGRDVGEVRGMTWARTEGARARTVLLECFVARPFDRELRQNSELFVATPSILGEAWLEIAPARGAPPGPPIAPGARLRGADPPELDEFIGRVYRALRGIDALLAEHRPALDRLVLALARLSATLEGAGLGPAARGALASDLRAAVDEARGLAGDLRASSLPAQAERTRAAVVALGDEATPRLGALGREAERVAAALEALSDLVPEAKRREMEAALSRLRAVARTAQSLGAEVAQLEALVERGDGTVGGLAADKELFDDLHETHRILKRRGWRLVARPRPPAKGTPPPAP